jgi:hypothetical protein
LAATALPGLFEPNIQIHRGDPVEVVSLAFLDYIPTKSIQPQLQNHQMNPFQKVTIKEQEESKNRLKLHFATLSTVQTFSIKFEITLLESYWSSLTFLFLLSFSKKSVDHHPVHYYTRPSCLGIRSIISKHSSVLRANRPFSMIAYLLILFGLFPLRR